DNTILIFMTDNGSSGGCSLANGGFVNNGYNAGMRGKKGSYYEGGHRVPFFIRWPGADIGGGSDVNELTTHMDILPTFIDLCNLEAPENLEFDGKNIAPLIRGEKKELPERKVFVQYRQSSNPPQKWDNAVMTQRWRLINGKELYDIQEDSGQKNDVSDKYPEVVKDLRQAHEDWWEEISHKLEERCPISLGNEAENPTKLGSMDVMGDVAWNQCHIARAKKSTGKWWVDVEKEGRYRFSLRRWPEELDLPINAGLSTEEVDEIAPYEQNKECNKIAPEKAQIKIFGQELIKKINCYKKEVSFELNLSQTGVTEFEAWFLSEDDYQGAYYVYVERIS
ncbi:MAG: sulfatase/phosphatase domain-containing protein, partial [Bacillota bacterium]